MEDIFAFDNIEFNSDNPKMTSVEFVEKTKKMLNEIMNEYSSAHSWRLITEEEFKVTPCDSCKGESEFEFCGKKVNCVQDRERGVVSNALLTFLSSILTTPFLLALDRASMLLCLA